MMTINASMFFNQNIQQACNICLFIYFKILNGCGNCFPNLNTMWMGMYVSWAAANSTRFIILGLYPRNRLETITDILEYFTSSDSKVTLYYAGHHTTTKMSAEL